MSKNCQEKNCGKGFGFFNKKAICQVCSNSFCEKCLQTNMSFPERGILPSHKICSACVTNLRNTPAPGAHTPNPFNPLASAPSQTKDPSSLDKQLMAMFEEQQLPINVRERIMKMDIGQKWSLLQAYSSSLTIEKSEKQQSSYWVSKLQTTQSQIWKEPEKMKRFLNTVKSQGKTWMIQFIREGGLSAILNGYHNCRSEEVRVTTLKAVSAIVMTEPGIEQFIKLNQAFAPLVLSSLAPTTSNDSRYELFDLLAFTCSAVPDEGHRLVTEALNMPECSRIPLKAFVDLLTAPQITAPVRFKLLVLFNATVNTPDSIDDRQHMRQLLRSAEFPKAADWLRQEANNARATIDGSSSNRLASPSINRSGSVRTGGLISSGSLTSITETGSATTIPIEEAKANRSVINQSGPLVSAQGVSNRTIMDQSEVWENIRVQLDLYDCAEEEDAIDATRNGIDFGSLSDLLEYIRVHMQPSVGQFLLPLLQMICIMPLDTAKGQVIWSEVLNSVKFIISGSQSDELLIKDELFALADQLASGTFSVHSLTSLNVNQNLMIEKQNVENQLNVLRERVRQLESQPTSGGDETKIREENTRLQQQLQVAQQQLAAAAAGNIPPPPQEVPPVTAVVPAEQTAQYNAALEQIKKLEAEVAHLRAVGPSAGAVASGPTTVIIQTPEPPCLAGFTPVPHQPRTVVIEGGAVLPPGAGAGVAPAVAPSNIPQPPCLPGFNAVAVTAPAGSVPSNGSPQPPVLAGFNPVGGAVGAAVPTAPAGGAACQADGKPWPPVLPGFKAQPGAPAAASSASAPTNTSASTPAAPPKPAEPEIKLPYKRQPIKPSTKMRNLHWAKLEDKVIENTIWNTLNDQRNIKLDAKDLEAVFCQQNKAAGPSSPIAEEAAAKTPAKATQITFIDGQRGQNMAIAISRFKPLTFEQMRDAILHMDFKAMSVDTAVALSKWLPTPEEVETVSSYEGPIADLQQTDRYVLIVGKVPAMDRRVEAFIFRCQFETTYDELKRKIEQCTAVLQRISSSKAIVRTLEYILALGNYLNGGTKKGDAYGFEIAFITRLQDTRSVDNKTNLLQYLLPILDKDPITATLQEAFVGIEEVARIDIAQLVGDVSKFNGSFNKIKGLITQLTKSAPAGCKFVTVMEPFVQSGEPKAKSLTTALQTITELSAGLAKSYGEETNKFGPSDVFKLYNDFNKQLTSVRQELKRLQEMKEKAEKMAAAAAAKGAAGGATKPPGPVLGGAPMGPGGKPPSMGLEGPGGANALAAAMANRRKVEMPNKDAKHEEEMAAKVQGTLVGSNPSEIMNAIKLRREERQATQGTVGKRKSILGPQPPVPPRP